MDSNIRNSDDKDPEWLLYIFCALIPLVGIFGGPYYLIKNEVGKGLGMFLVGIIFLVIYSIILG